MKEPSVEALVEEAKLWTTDALVRDTLDILAQRIAELEAKLAEAETAMEKIIAKNPRRFLNVFRYRASIIAIARDALRSLRGET